VDDQIHTVAWSDTSAGQRYGPGVTHLDSLPFACVPVQLELALVLMRIKSPPHGIMCTSPFDALKFAIQCGRVDVVRKLLQRTPNLLDLEVDRQVRESGTYDKEPLYIACSADSIRPDARLQLVRTLLEAYKSRAVQHGHAGTLFFSLDRSGFKASFEYRALQAARLHGHTACAEALIEAQVPLDASMHTDPQERAMVEAILDQDYASAGAMVQQHMPGVITPEGVHAASKLFGGNDPMAFGYLVGHLRLENRPPPGGWGALDPGGAKAKALRDALMTQTQLRDYESQLLHSEMQRLRDDLLREQGPQKVGHELLAFVCNPDRDPNPRHRLPQALNDALAASYGMPATIIGGAIPPAHGQPERWSAAVTEDRTCTFDRLERELTVRSERKQLPSAFLFSGHADAGSGHKTLGFTQADGVLAPLVDGDKVAALFGNHARRADSSSGIQLLVLNGCASYDLGRACCDRGVPFVICWRTLVHDEAAYLFVRGFFRALGRSARHEDDYLRAFEAGKAAVTEKTRVVRTTGGGIDKVPYFELSDPTSGRMRVGNSFAAGVPVLLTAEPCKEHM